MALVKCPECGNSVSDRAESCPTCAYPLAERATAQANVTPPPIIHPISPLPVGVTTQANVGKVQTGEQNANRPKHRLWFALLAVVALIAALSVPELFIGFGLILWMLCIMTFIPHIQDFSRRLLRLNQGEKMGRVLRVTLYGFIGFILMIMGTGGVVGKAEQDRIAAEKSEQQRLTNEANSQVAVVVKEAEAAWRDGNSALAEVKLELASKTPKASDFDPIRKLRARIANAKVKTLVADAINTLKSDDIDSAIKKVQAALAVPYANALTDAKKLDQQIGNATDPSRLRATLMELSDNSFKELQEGGEMPKQLTSGYEALDSSTADILARTQLDDIAAAREKQRQEQLERERVAAEAAKKAQARMFAAGKAKSKPRAIKAAKAYLESQMEKDGGYMSHYSMESASFNNEDGSWSVSLSGLFVGSSDINYQNFDVVVDYHVSFDGRVLDPDRRIGMRLKKW